MLIIYLDGGNNAYQLLDDSGQGDSKYFVLRSHVISDEKFKFDEDGKTAVFNPSKPGNIAHKLNNHILNTYIEPQFAQYIDYNHVWITGGANVTWRQNAANNATVSAWITETGGTAQQYVEQYIPKSDYETICGVSVLSFDEYFKYLDKFGYVHNPNDNNRYAVMRSFIYQTNTGTYPYGPAVADSGYRGNDKTYDTDANNIGRIYRGSIASDTTVVRPCFWLKPDFFKHIRIDVNRTGEEVKKTIRQNYHRNELAVIYSDAELEALGYSSNVPVIGDILVGGNAAVGQQLTALFTYQNAVPVEYQWYISDHVNGPYTEIAGANGSSYIVRSSDLGKYIKVSILFNDDLGNSIGYYFSEASAKIKEALEITPVLKSLTFGGASNIQTATSAEAVFTITNNGDSAKNVLLIIAVYDGSNGMLALNYIPENISVGTNDYSVSLSGFSGASSIKTFVWESFETMRPLYFQQSN